MHKSLAIQWFLTNAYTCSNSLSYQDTEHHYHFRKFSLAPSHILTHFIPEETIILIIFYHRLDLPVLELGRPQ